jgi:hypothetical protein
MVNRTRVANFTADDGRNTIRSVVGASIQLQFSGSPVGVHVDLVDGTMNGQGRTTLDLAESTYVTMYASPHADSLHGSDADDNFDDVGGGDVVDGRGGDDVIEAREGGRGPLSCEAALART